MWFNHFPVTIRNILFNNNYKQLLLNKNLTNSFYSLTKSRNNDWLDLKMKSKPILSMAFSDQVSDDNQSSAASARAKKRNLNQVPK